MKKPKPKAKRFRSAISGRIVSPKYAFLHPTTTVAETVKKPRRCRA